MSAIVPIVDLRLKLGLERAGHDLVAAIVVLNVEGGPPELSPTSNACAIHSDTGRVSTALH